MTITSCIAGLLTVLTLTNQTERTIPVEEGSRLEISNYAGEIIIKAWDKDEIRLLADHGSRDEVQIIEGKKLIEVRARSTRGKPSIVDYQLSVPAWLDLELSGPYCDIDVAGMAGDVAAETMEGQIRVRGGHGTISLRSVEGDIELEGADGHIEVICVSGDLRLRELSGRIEAESIDGDVDLIEVTSSEVMASTVDGDVRYDGSVDKDGSYSFTTHDGDLYIGVGKDDNVTLSLAIVEGDLDACFDLGASERHGRRRTVVLGNGSAHMELETFDGDIELCPPRKRAKGS